MIYRVNYYDDADGSAGFKFAGTRREANRLLRAWQQDSPDSRVNSEIDIFPTPHTKAELLSLLEQVATHPDNG